jgi:hypothetical protein
MKATATTTTTTVVTGITLELTLADATELMHICDCNISVARVIGRASAQGFLGNVFRSLLAAGVARPS